MNPAHVWYYVVACGNACDSTTESSLEYCYIQAINCCIIQHTHTNTHTHIYIYTHTQYIHTHIQVYIQAYILIHKDIYILSQKLYFDLSRRQYNNQLFIVLFTPPITVYSNVSTYTVYSIVYIILKLWNSTLWAIYTSHTCSIYRKRSV